MEIPAIKYLTNLNLFFYFGLVLNLCHYFNDTFRKIFWKMLPHLLKIYFLFLNQIKNFI